MIRAVRPRWLALALVLALVAVLTLRPAVVLAPLGRFLVTADPLVRADVAVPLSGAWIERAFAARDLFRAGWARRILLFEAARPWFAEEVERSGIPLVLPHEIDRRLLAAAGVPADAVELLAPAENTLAEARAIARFVKGRGWSSVIVVTSKVSARRACWTVRQVLENIAAVYCHPSPYDRFDPERWWRDDKSALLVATEYLKLVANLASYGPRPRLTP